MHPRYRQGATSPRVDAANTGQLIYTHRRILSLPRLARYELFLSLVLDSAVHTLHIARYALTLYNNGQLQGSALTGDASTLLPALLRTLKDLHSSSTYQIFTFSPLEYKALQTYLVDTALLDDSPMSANDLQFLISCLYAGSDMLMTNFIPSALQEIWSVLSQSKPIRKAKLQALIARLGESTVGTVEQLLLRLKGALGGMADQRSGFKPGLEKVVVLKRAFSKLLVVPVPGWTELDDLCAALGSARIKSDADTYDLVTSNQLSGADIALQARNAALHRMLHRIYESLAQQEGGIEASLVNEASSTDSLRHRELTMSLCRHRE